MWGVWGPFECLADLIRTRANFVADCTLHNDGGVGLHVECVYRLELTLAKAWALHDLISGLCGVDVRALW